MQITGPIKPQTTTKRVVAAVIERANSFLICRRPADKKHGDLWEFPGGKVHEGETLVEAVARELNEELGVETASTGPVLFTAVDQQSGYEIMFIPTVIMGDPQPLEHSALEWCNRTHLLDFDLAPTDRAFATFFVEVA